MACCAWVQWVRFHKQWRAGADICTSSHLQKDAVARWGPSWEGGDYMVIVTDTYGAPCRAPAGARLEDVECNPMMTRLVLVCAARSPQPKYRERRQRLLQGWEPTCHLRLSSTNLPWESLPFSGPHFSHLPNEEDSFQNMETKIVSVPDVSHYLIFIYFKKLLNVTILKWTNQWHLVYSQYCLATTST